MLLPHAKDHWRNLTDSLFQLSLHKTQETNARRRESFKKFIWKSQRSVRNSNQKVQSGAEKDKHGRTKQCMKCTTKTRKRWNAWRVWWSLSQPSSSLLVPLPRKILNRKSLEKRVCLMNEVPLGEYIAYFSIKSNTIECAFCGYWDIVRPVQGISECISYHSALSIHE